MSSIRTLIGKEETREYLQRRFRSQEPPGSQLAIKQQLGSIRSEIERIKTELGFDMLRAERGEIQ